MFRWKTAILHSYRSNLRLENRNQRNQLLRERRNRMSLKKSLIMMINFVKLAFQIFAHNLWRYIADISILLFYQFCWSQYFSIVLPNSSSTFLTDLRFLNFLLPNYHLNKTFKLVFWRRLNSLRPVLNFNGNIVFPYIRTHIVFNSVVAIVKLWLFLFNDDFRHWVFFFRKHLHFPNLFPFKLA